MFKLRFGCTNFRLEAGLGLLIRIMGYRLLNQTGVLAPLIFVRQPVKQPVHMIERQASAVQGRGQLVHSIYRMCG